MGIPTIDDRVAQMIIKNRIEPVLEPIFYNDSYGYRPNKSAIDAIGTTRERCWKMPGVLEFDIVGMFDNINHGMLMKALKKHVSEKWILLYTERSLKAPMSMSNGDVIERTKGTPQGGVGSPIWSNLFMHYCFDSWMSVNFSRNPWVRYADDGLVHCVSKKQAKALGLKSSISLSKTLQRVSSI